MEGWTTESVLKKHNLWRELTGPDAGATAVTLQWLGMRISRLELALRNWLCETGGDDEEERNAARELLGLSPTWPHDQPGFVSGEYFIGEDGDEFPMKVPGVGPGPDQVPPAIKPLPTDWTPTMYLRFVKRAVQIRDDQPTKTIRFILQQGYAHVSGDRIWVDVPTVEEGT